MLLLGLTGSIATGKSTVSTILRNPPYNLPIIDADVLARQVVEPGTPGYQKIVAYFSSTTPDLLLEISEQGSSSSWNVGRPLNRAALGRRVFGDDPERRRDRAVLNGIVHPAVRKQMYRELLFYFLHGYWAVVLDIPLLFESGLDLLCGIVLVVAVTDPKVQIQRLLDRNPELTPGPHPCGRRCFPDDYVSWVSKKLDWKANYVPEDARNRVQSQGDAREKAERAEARGTGRGFALWNDGRKEDLEKEVEQVMRKIRANSPGWWALMLLLLPPLGGIVALFNLIRNRRAKSTWEARKIKEKSRL